MRNLIILLAATLITFPYFYASAQEEPASEIMEVTEDSVRTTVTIDDDDLVIIEDGKDTTRIKIGNKGIEIIEDTDGSTRINVKDLKDTKEVTSKKKTKFKGHWSGFELGLNNYVNSDFSSSLDPSFKYMDLNTNKSLNVNLNFIQYDLGFGTDKAGLVTGMGFEFSNYFFDGNNNIRKDENGQIVEFIPAFVTEPGATMIKSKLATTCLTVPLLIEFQIPAGKKRIHLSGGVIGGAKIGSSTKIVYKERGDRQKDKVKDDFNISPLRYGFTLRAGYRNLNLFANYYPVPLFEKGKGPELYPYSVGLRLLSF